jgi:hypothetical protein
VTSIPREAREGLMRAWLEILRERHPEVTWIARGDESVDESGVGSAGAVEPAGRQYDQRGVTGKAARCPLPSDNKEAHA